ncbi:MAG: TIGR00730 family Rossman fold protein [Bacteroidales bacterium]|nr:TIGR00730 family Rossman fold protein [Candidatus Cacconaster scatequi]
MKSVAVYLGSAAATAKWRDFAYDFGKRLACSGMKVIYGGADVGTMASLADGVLAGNGHLTGVLPAGFGGKRKVAAQGRNILRKDVTENVEVSDLSERKKMMRQLSDCCVILPGSFGTMDELFCYVVENEVGIHDKKAYVLNIDGYYDGLEMQVAAMKREGFIDRASAILVFVHSIEEFFRIIENFKTTS